MEEILSSPCQGPPEILIFHSLNWIHRVSLDSREAGG